MSASDIPGDLRSKRDAAGRFLHPWAMEDGGTRGLGDMVRWQRERMRNGVAPTPPAEAFERAVPLIATPRAGADELRITWVGHSTFLLQLAGINILTDPVWSRRASPIGWIGPARLVPAVPRFEDLPPIDVVLLSHDHYDHLDSRTVEKLHRRDGGIRWVTPLGYHGWLARRGIRDVVELDWWDNARVDTRAGALTVHAAPAQHWTKRTPFTERTRLWASFVLRANGRSVYFAGDSGWFDGYRAIGSLGPFDAVLMPIGAYDPRWFMKPAHMNPEEAVRAWVDLGATGLFTGMHWGTFRLTDEPPLEPPARTRAEWQARGLPDDLLWLPRHGETRILNHR